MRPETEHAEQAASRFPDADARRRVVIEGVTPEIDGGRFPIKRIVGDIVTVEADIFADGHDQISGVLLFRYEDDEDWSAVPVEPLVNDRWRAHFTVARMGCYYYALQAWIDPFQSWQRDLRARIDAEQDIDIDLRIGAQIVASAAGRADGHDRERLQAFAATLAGDSDQGDRAQAGLSEELVSLMSAYPDTSLATTYDRGQAVVVDRERARFSTWYEMFPRSASTVPGKHGTFKDVEARLPYIAQMGFDVLYLPPIHPIGRTYRKGRNNNVVAEPGAPGSPWAIGAVEGGHTAIHPELGTLDDFCQLVGAARKHGIEIALDIAFQTSPDHPWVSEHPEWFRHRPDGTIQYAENPPKKYQDIYPLNFESEDWASLWSELAGVFRFWIAQGVSIFRVDNPHTKPFRFWEWLIAEIKRDHPETIFLSEAFTRPKVMYYLAKCGFSQSYTYFTWRHDRRDITEYLTELTQTPVREYFRPNLWPNTPDILTEELQLGGRPTFVRRLILAATLGASYGIYGPAFELGEHEPIRPGSEEYLNSEKYEIRHWDLDRPDSLRDLIARVNRIRRDYPALQQNATLRFHPTDNEQLIAYSKTDPAGGHVVLTVVNLDPNYTQSGWVDLPLHDFGIDPNQPFTVHDLLTNAHYRWQGWRNYVKLDPHAMAAHILVLGRNVRNERDFEYFL